MSPTWMPKTWSWFPRMALAIRVIRPGKYNVALVLKVPVGLKRAAGPGERGFDLGLPGAAVTTLSLKLPRSVREIRWNGNVEKNRPTGKWDLLLSSAKTLELTWKEQSIPPGIGPLLTADGQIAVKLEESGVLVTAKLKLADLRGQERIGSFSCRPRPMWKSRPRPGWRRSI